MGFDDLKRGEAVTLREASSDTLGRIVSVSDDGRTADVHWQRRPGHEHDTTREPTTALRRAHESEAGMSA